MIAFYDFSEVVSMSADLIPSGINKHGIVVAQSVVRERP